MRLEVLSDFQAETAVKENKKALSTAERRVKELDEFIEKIVVHEADKSEGRLNSIRADHAGGKRRQADGQRDTGEVMEHHFG